MPKLHKANCVILSPAKNPGFLHFADAIQNDSLTGTEAEFGGGCSLHPPHSVFDTYPCPGRGRVSIANAGEGSLRASCFKFSA